MIFRVYFPFSSIISSSYRRIILRTTTTNCYFFGTSARPDPSTFLFRPDKVEIVEEVESKLDRGEVKYRRHPGVLQLPVQRVEREVELAIGRAVTSSNAPLAQYKANGVKLERHLHNRRLPMEHHDLLKLRADIERRVREKEAQKVARRKEKRQQQQLSPGGGREENAEETSEALVIDEEKIRAKCERRFKTSVYAWEAMKYDSPSKCLTYCLLRFAPEFAALRRVFHEIAKRLPSFSPRHVLDFGSGVGTTFCAAQSIWNAQSVEEYVCVEPSDDMVEFFRTLLQQGDEGLVGKRELLLRHRNINFRKFLPASAEREYDLVVSAYSMFELPSYEERMRLVANLWMKTKHVLVLVERGTNAGHRAVMEARDYILAGGHEIYRNALKSSLISSSSSDPTLDLVQVELLLKRSDLTESEKFRLLRHRYPDVRFPTLIPHGHVFGPCPHDSGCPRSAMDVTPCNFPVRYFPLRLGGGAEVPKRELYSYVVLRKGYRGDQDQQADYDWPRIVREPRKSKACVWCQLCTKHGVLEDNPFYKGATGTERGKLYRLAKRSEWGDRLPVISTYQQLQQQDDDGQQQNQQQQQLDDDENIGDGNDDDQSDQSPAPQNK